MLHPTSFIKKASLGCCFIGLLFCMQGFAHAEDDTLYEILRNLRANVENVANLRSYRIKDMNDSISSLSQAMNAMSQNERVEKIENFLNQAEEEYPENYFVHLLWGIVYDAKDKVFDSNTSFENFLIRSRSYGDFERAFIPWREFHYLRRVVYERLLANGVSFEGREEEIQVRIPFEAFAQYLKNPEKEDQILNGIFVLILVLGIPLLILSHFAEADFNSFWLSSFVALYATTWVAYLGWMADLLFGLPFLISRWKVTLILYAIVFLIHLSLRLMKYFTKRFQPIQAGYHRCPACSEVIQKILRECPNCRKKLN